MATPLPGVATLAVTHLSDVATAAAGSAGVTPAVSVPPLGASVGSEVKPEPAVIEPSAVSEAALAGNEMSRNRPASSRSRNAGGLPLGLTEIVWRSRLMGSFAFQ